MRKREIKKKLKLIESGNGMLIPKELRQPIQIQKGYFELYFGELGRILDLLIDPLTTLTNTIIPIIYDCIELYVNSLSDLEIENFIYLAENQRYWGI